MLTDPAPSTFFGVPSGYNVESGRDHLAGVTMADVTHFLSEIFARSR